MAVDEGITCLCNSNIELHHSVVWLKIRTHQSSYTAHSNLIWMFFCSKKKKKK